MSAALIVAAAARETEDERREGELPMPRLVPAPELELELASGGVPMVRCCKGDADVERDGGSEFKSGGMSCLPAVRGECLRAVREHKDCRMLVV